MTWLDNAGLDESRQQTVRALLDELLRQPPALQRAHLRELTTDVETIAIVEQLLDQRTRSLGEGAAPTGEVAAKPPATELQAGDVLGTWRLVERIASGGMGTVFVAERADELYRQRVAIKLLHGRADAATAQRMATERQLLAQLQHPGIARLYDGGTTPAGHPYLVMEYVEGLPLHRHCRERRPGLQARIELFQRICRAVQAAHRHLIVHCDLKPGNVLVRADGEPVLLDFGIARALEAGGDGGGFCTPAYASPELLAGRPVSTASDVFSLGVLLAELLSARRVPREPGDPAGALPMPSRIAEGDAIAWRAKLRGDLDAIVARATAADPEQRYASVAELHDDLQRHRQHKPVLARAGSTGYRLRRLLRRRWRGAAVLAAVALLSGVFVWQLAHERSVAQRQALIAEQVSDLLADSLQSADPKDGQGSTELTARQLLDASAQRLGQVSDPAVLARLRDVLGNAYLHLGQSAVAEPLMIAAADGYLDPSVRRPLRAADVLNELSVLQSNSGHKKDAVATARRALALVEVHGGGPLDLADSLNSLGIALVDVDNDESQRVLERALELRMRHIGENSVEVASVLHNLGMLARHRAQWKQAEDYYRHSLAIKDAIGETDSARYEYSLSGLAMSLRGQNRLAEAAELQREILRFAIHLYGEGDSVSSAYNELAYTLHDLGRWAEAKPNYAASERLAAEASGEDSIDFAVSLNNHAYLDEDRGALDEAERRFRRSLAIRRAALDPDSPSVLRASLNLGRLLLRQDRLQEAGPLIEQSWAAWQRKHDPHHENSVGHRLLYAEWLIADGEVAQARAELDALAADVERAKHVAWRESLLADLGRAAGDRASVLEHRRRAVQAWADDLGPDHVEAARVRVAYAEALLADGDVLRARDELAHAQRVLLPQLAPQAPLLDRMQALQARLGPRLAGG